MGKMYSKESKTEEGVVVDFTKVEPIQKGPEEITKSISFKKSLYDTLKAQAKANGHSIKEALDYGARAYLAAYPARKAKAK